MTEEERLKLRVRRLEEILSRMCNAFRRSPSLALYQNLVTVVMESEYLLNYQQPKAEPPAAPRDDYVTREELLGALRAADEWNRGAGFGIAAAQLKR